MRFKAKLAPEHVTLLSNLIGPISKLAPSSSPISTTGGDDHGSASILNGGGGTVIHLDPDHVRISTRGGSRSAAKSSSSSGGGGDDATTGGAEGISCFAELTTTDGIFLEHRIESAADDVIVFEIDLGQLKVALQSVLGALGRGGGGGFGGGGNKGGGENANPLYNSMAPGGGGGGTTNGGGGHGVTTMNSSAPAPATLTPSIVIMKLAKRHGGLPCLCLDVTSLPGRGSVEVHHAIPIRVMRAVEMQYHLPPRISMPQVQLELPFDRPIKTVVDRLKTMSPHIYIEGSMDGELTLRIDGDGASIRTFYGKLIPRFEDLEEDSSSDEEEDGDDDESDADNHDHDGGGEHDDDDDENNDNDGDGGSRKKRRRRKKKTKKKPKKTKTCTLKVDSRKLSACLQWQGTMLLGRSVGSAVLCMVKNEMLCLHCMLNPGTVGFFTYYVPVHYLSPDQMDF